MNSTDVTRSGPAGRAHEVAWCGDWELGLKEVDAQHRRLVDLLNRAQSVADRRSDEGELRRTLCDLLAYTQVHFEHEERLMERHSLQDRAPEHVERHVREHQSFERGVHELLERFRVGDRVDGELVGTLTAWLGSHIRGRDREMGLLLADAA